MREREREREREGIGEHMCIVQYVLKHAMGSIWYTNHCMNVKLYIGAIIICQV